MNFLRRFLWLFNRRERFRLGLLGVLLLFASLFEVVSIGVVLPFLKIIGEPKLALEHERIGPLLRDVGLTSDKRVIIAACVLMLALFVVKGLYVAATWRLFYIFLTRKMVSLSKQLLQAYLKTSYLFHRAVTAPISCATLRRKSRTSPAFSSSPWCCRRKSLW